MLRRMKKPETGFTLIELMIVVLIVAILAAAALPIYRGRMNSAKWAEGKTMLGTIATAIRVYAAENGSAATTPTLDFAQGPTSLGFAPGDLTGTYFTDSDFSISSVDLTAAPIAFTIHCGTSVAGAPSAPAGFTLDQEDAFTAD
ncbi:MAG: type IV pilin protein [Planctomycetota bacterium]|jgi:prepilin-type N-terminal cleavage/methylation domain-containing protein